MQLDFKVLDRVEYLIGTAEIVSYLTAIRSLTPGSDEIVEFLNDVSREIMCNPQAKKYSDVITFGFWIRKGSVLKMKECFFEDGFIHLGKGIAFHIAPSNVPVNFAYSLVAGLICGNANIVRIPSKDFPQIAIIIEAFNKVLEKYEKMKPYVICVRYGRDKEVNDLFSSIADVRIVWGGDETIKEIRKSPMPPRSSEITFADRYSLAVIDSDFYLAIEDKERIAENFYNDTFFTDQNACTSPRIIIWIGSQIERAKELFWKSIHDLVQEKYKFQDIQGVNKIANAYMTAVMIPGIKIEPHNDNLIIRVEIPKISDNLMHYKGNCGYFYEYNCKDIESIVDLVNDNHCQTIGYIGSSNMIKPLVEFGVKGIDRVVPIGKTMDFDLIWDGYNLPALLTRTIFIA